MPAISDLRVVAVMQQGSESSNVPPTDFSDVQGTAEARGEQLTGRPGAILTRNGLPAGRALERYESSQGLDNVSCSREE